MTCTIPPSHVLVVHKPLPEVTALAQKMRLWLEAQQCRATVVQSGVGHVAYETLGAELVVVLGGDGSMLGVARHFVEKPVPLIGVNFGRVGFLADVSADQWEKGISAFLAGQTCVVKRMALRWQVQREGRVLQSGVAINDVVVNRGSLSRVVCLDVGTDNTFICRLRADGLIISSPLGASGYAVSAGGPLVYPGLNALSITPICPFLCNFPPMVLPYPMQVRATVLPESTATHLTIDGQEGVALEPGDIVCVDGVPEGIHFSRIRPDGYFVRLRARGFIEEHSASTPHNCGE